MSEWKRGPYGTNERADSVYWQYDNGTAKRSVLIPLSVEQAIIRSHPLFTLAQDIINSALADVEPTDDPADCCGMDAGDAHEHGAQAEHRRIADLLAAALAPWEETKGSNDG